MIMLLSYRLSAKFALIPFKTPDYQLILMAILLVDTLMKGVYSLPSFITVFRPDNTFIHVHLRLFMSAMMKCVAFLHFSNSVKQAVERKTNSELSLDVIHYLMDRIKFNTFRKPSERIVLSEPLST